MRILIIVLITFYTASAKSSKSTYEIPPGLIKGGSFIDLFLPVPYVKEVKTDLWGAPNVIPRDESNGLENSEYSYWGGNIITGDDGKEHMFVCRWPEDHPKGHKIWWDSEVVHAISDHPLGPYKVIEVIGKGHNPEIYRRKDGSYIIGVLGNKAYKASSLKGPWKEIKSTMQFDEKETLRNTTNRTYVVRQDGSVLMMNKPGCVFISKNANEEFVQLTGRIYPSVKKAKFEDPVIWKDEVQYHCVVNDWLGRRAFYLRSEDGVQWEWEPGIAYDPRIFVHVDGAKESWYKFERPKVRQDKYGRATHMNFAVIDVLKAEDRGSDIHSSKNVVIPLKVPRRLEILNKADLLDSRKAVHVKIYAEKGFDPHTQIDFASLIFGSSEQVDFGKGSKLISQEKSGKDLILIFEEGTHKLKANDFAAKLIGKSSSGQLLFGFASTSK